MAHTKARAQRDEKWRRCLADDQWAAPEGSGASVEETNSRPPYNELESDPAFREPWPMPGCEGEAR